MASARSLSATARVTRSRGYAALMFGPIKRPEQPQKKKASRVRKVITEQLMEAPAQQFAQ